MKAIPPPINHRTLKGFACQHAAVEGRRDPNQRDEDCCPLVAKRGKPCEVTLASRDVAPRTGPTGAEAKSQRCCNFLPGSMMAQMSRVAASRALLLGAVGAGRRVPRRPHFCNHRRERHGNVVQEPDDQRVVRGVMAAATVRVSCPMSPSHPRAARFTSFSQTRRGDKGDVGGDRGDAVVASSSSSEDTNKLSFSLQSAAVSVESLTVTQLKAVLRSRGEPLTGKKQELVARVSVKSVVIQGEDIVLFQTQSASASSSASASVDKTNTTKQSVANKNKAPPVLRWTVTDPPLPPRKAPLSDTDENSTLRVISWNVNGIRALLGKDVEILNKLADSESAHVVCLQETKIQTKDVDAVDAVVLPEFPYRLWNCSTSKLGYSGTALFSKIKPINTWVDPFEVFRDGSAGDENEKYFQNEGRVVVFEFRDCFVVGAYVPNSGSELKRLGERTSGWDPAMSQYLKKLETKKPVVYCGDLNVAADAVDLWGNHAANAKSAGFTPEERSGFLRYYGIGKRIMGGGDTDKTEGASAKLARGTTENTASVSLLDTFRVVHGDARGYTWYSYRGGARNKNRGWRIDYVLASDSETLTVHDAYIRGDIGGSDHCPVGAVFRVGECLRVAERTAEETAVRSCDESMAG